MIRTPGLSHLVKLLGRHGEGKELILRVCADSTEPLMTYILGIVQNFFELNTRYSYLAYHFFLVKEFDVSSMTYTSEAII